MNQSMVENPEATTGSLTMREMCEHIVKSGVLKRKDGQPVTAEAVYNYSPRGELFMVFEWFKIACAMIGEPK